MRNGPSPHVPLLSSDRMSGFGETPPSRRGKNASMLTAQQKKQEGETLNSHEAVLRRISYIYFLPNDLNELKVKTLLVVKTN